MPNMDKLRRLAEEKAQEAVAKYQETSSENPTSARPGPLGKLGKLNEGLEKFIEGKTKKK